MRGCTATGRWRLWSNSLLRESSDLICLSTCFLLHSSTLLKYYAIITELWIFINYFIEHLLGSLCRAKSEGCYRLVLLPSQVDQTARFHGRYGTICAILHGRRTYILCLPNNKYDWTIYFYSRLVMGSPYFPHILDAWSKRHHPNMHFMWFEDMKRVRSNIQCKKNKLMT